MFPGQEIFFRWFDVNDSGNDHALAVDDLTISFTSFTAVTNAPGIAPSGQPQSLTNNAGTRATFTVTATGTAPSYQWQLNASDLSDGGNISGSTTPSLSISNVLAVDAGSYTVIVANGAGSINSAAAVLTVIDPAVNTQPASRTNIAGDTANFFVGAAGTGPLSYQWRFNGTDIAGANGGSLNVLNVQSTNAGSYAVVVGNSSGNYTTSAVANLTLLATPATSLARWDFNATNVLVVTRPPPPPATARPRSQRRHRNLLLGHVLRSGRRSGRRQQRLEHRHLSAAGNQQQDRRRSVQCQHAGLPGHSPGLGGEAQRHRQQIRPSPVHHGRHYIRGWRCLHDAEHEQRFCVLHQRLVGHSRR